MRYVNEKYFVNAPLLDIFEVNINKKELENLKNC